MSSPEGFSANTDNDTKDLYSDTSEAANNSEIEEITEEESKKIGHKTIELLRKIQERRKERQILGEVAKIEDLDPHVEIDGVEFLSREKMWKNE